MRNANKLAALACGMMVPMAFSAGKQTDVRPNILFILADDLGVGQFAPLASALNEENFDPKFADYVRRLPADVSYSGADALQAVRQSMPTLSRLAEGGVVFTRAYSSSSLCNPSRVGIATAMHPNRFGIYQNWDVTGDDGTTKIEQPFPPERILMPAFQKAGYATGHIGKWHLSGLDEELLNGVQSRYRQNKDPNKGALTKYLNEAGYFGSMPAAMHPLNNGFDYYYGYNYHQSEWYNAMNVWDGFKPVGKQAGYNTDVFTQKAIDFIGSAKDQGKPFFLNLHVHAVHGPLVPNPPAKYMEPFKEMPGLLKNFYGHLFALDENIRRIVETLRQNGQLANTIIVFASDNGGAVSHDSTLPGNAPHRGQKGQYTLGGVRVPLVVSWPEKIRQGRRTGELATLLDIMPTAMDAAGIAVPEGLDGRSLLPLIGGGEKGPHDQLVWFGLHSRYWGFEVATAVSKNMPEITRDEPGAWVVVKDDWVLRFTGAIVPGKYRDVMQGAPSALELYSIDKDPGEKNNLAAKYPEVVGQLRKEAGKWANGIQPPNCWMKSKWDELVAGAQEGATH